MEDRKRRLESPVPSSGSLPQKRRLSGIADSTARQQQPQSRTGDGAAAGDEAENTDEASLDAVLGLENGFLESFRKGALHRHLLEARRDYERAQQRADKLESDWKESQQRLASVEACWKQIIAELGSALQGPNQSEWKPPPVQNGQTTDSHNQPIYEMQQLIKAFTSKLLAGEINKDILRRCEMLSGEIVESRASHTLLEAVLERTKDELSAATEALRIAERKADRERDGAVSKLDARVHGVESGRRAKEKAAKEMLDKEQAASAELSVKQEGRSSPDLRKSEVEGVGDVNMTDDKDLQEGSSGLTRDEIARLQFEAAQRVKEIDSLKSSTNTLRDTVQELEQKLANPSKDVVSRSQLYTSLATDNQTKSELLDTAQEQLRQAQTEATSLREGQEAYKAQIEKTSNDTVEELNKKLIAVNTDLGRIRAERDARLGELAEMQAARDAKMRHSDQMKALAESRQQRISVLVSEIQRLRMKAAADAGDQATLNLIVKYGKTSSEPVDNLPSADHPLPEEAVLGALQKELTEARQFIDTLRKNLATVTEVAEGSEDLEMAEAIMRREAQAVSDLEDANAKLAKLESLLTSDGASLDTAKMVKKLEEADETIKKLEANAVASNMTTEMLVAEVSKLSEVWDTLNKQNRDKILELAQYERRIEQISMEKQKAIQKYFACEREKEAIANEREAHMRVAASAKAAIELMREEERSLNAKITAAELEITKRQTFLDEAYKEQKKVANSLTTAESDVARYKRERDQEASSHLERKKELQDETAARKKADEDCAKLAFELEQTKKRLEATSSGTASKSRYANLDARELQQECDNLYTLLRCSSCKLRFKSHILLRCSHLLCKECIDARLDTRQRKCPTCQMPFGAADVQQVYMSA